MLGSWLKIHVKILIWKGLWSGAVVYVLEEHKVNCHETEIFLLLFSQSIPVLGVIDLRR